MAGIRSDYVTGTITLTNGSAAFTGTGTGWLAGAFQEGDTIFDVTGATEYMGVIDTITTNGAGTLTKVWEGPTLAGVAYRMRYQPDGSRMGAQARQLIEILGNGNILAFAELDGTGGNLIPMFDGAGSMVLVPKLELVSGVAYDVQVNDIAARAAYDGQLAGYSVLVSDVGDGRSAVYSKNSNTSGDWSDPAYVTGPIGDMPILTVEPTVTLDPGQPANVEIDPITGGYTLTFSIPAGRGPVPQGTYNGATAYVLDDAVLYNGSTFIALGPTTGNAPPTLPTTSNDFWQLLARQGTDGAGTGDVVGPAGATDNRVAVFDGATGKLLKDGGKTIAELTPVGYANLLISTSILALQVADNTNAAIFGFNWVADSFDALTYVDVAGATNLDTSAAGILKPTSLTNGNDSFTKVLLHFDGTDGSTTITDSNAGGSAHTWAVAGNAQLDTGIAPKFGTASLLCDGADDRVYMADHADVSLGSGDWCAEIWFNRQGGNGATRWMFGQMDSSGTGASTSIYMDLTTANVVHAVARVGGVSVGITGTTAFTATGWHHAALVRTGNTVKMFVDGVQEGGDQAVSGSVQESTNQFSVGAGGEYALNMWNGLLDEFRLSVGTPRYTANFTPPVAAFASGSTVNNLTVRSTSFTAASAPVTMKALIRVKEVDAAVAGTDYTFECSRDGGTTWATMTLTELFTSPSPVASIRVVEAAETVVSAQPSGTSPRWRFKTLNNKMIELHDVHANWD